jgi:alkylation response protein AidB-like acyl-CoA dehydrogenase
MHMLLTDEQAMLQSSALDWLSSHHSIQANSTAAEKDHWKAFAALGWLSLPFREDLGGIGGGPIEAGLLMHAMGRHLVTQPYLSHVLMAGQLLQCAGSAEQQTRLLPGVMSGELRMALAHGERGMVLPWDAPRLLARKNDSGWVLDGVKTVVDGGDSASLLIVSAVCHAGIQRLFLVDATQAGLERHAYRCLHGGLATDIRLQAVTVANDNVLENAGSGSCAEHLQRAMALGVLAHCWGASGVMSMLVEQTASYVQQRRQFGRRLSEFQAVQHGLAEMMVENTEALACCQSTSMRAAIAGAHLPSLAAAAKARSARAADYVAKQAIQLHGAMGVCEELPVAAAFRWLEAFQLQYGLASVHASFLARSTLQSAGHAYSSVLQECP